MIRTWFDSKIMEQLTIVGFDVVLVVLVVLVLLVVLVVLVRLLVLVLVLDFCDC